MENGQEFKLIVDGVEVACEKASTITFNVPPTWKYDRSKVKSMDDILDLLDIFYFELSCNEDDMSDELKRLAKKGILKKID